MIFVSSTQPSAYSTGSGRSSLVAKAISSLTLPSPVLLLVESVPSTTQLPLGCNGRVRFSQEQSKRTGTWIQKIGSTIKWVTAKYEKSLVLLTLWWPSYCWYFLLNWYYLSRRATVAAHFGLDRKEANFFLQIGLFLCQWNRFWGSHS